MRGRRAASPPPPRPTLPQRGRRMPGGRVGIRRGRALRPVPRERPPAGATDAGGRPIRRQALPSGSATKRVPSLDFTRNNSACLPSLRASATCLRTSAGIGDRLAADIENDVADLEAVIGGDAVRIDRGDHHAVAVAPGTCCRRQRQAELGHIAVGQLDAASARFAPGLLIRQRAERQGHGLFLALVDHGRA